MPSDLGILTSRAMCSGEGHSPRFKAIQKGLAVRGGYVLENLQCANLWGYGENMVKDFNLKICHPFLPNCP